MSDPLKQTPDVELDRDNRLNRIERLDFKSCAGCYTIEECRKARRCFAVPRASAPAQTELKPIAWRHRHSRGHGSWLYSDGEPTGPSIHLFEVEALYRPLPPQESIWRTDLDNAPRDGTQILARWHTDVFDVISWIEGDWMDGESRVGAPTHWRPIEPPHSQEENAG